MKIDSLEMAEAFYESRNPGCRWHRLSWFEKVHMAVLAERAACANLVRSMGSTTRKVDDIAIAIESRGGLI